MTLPPPLPNQPYVTYPRVGRGVPDGVTSEGLVSATMAFWSLRAGR